MGCFKINFVSADKCYTTVWNDYIDESWQEVLDMGTWKQILGKPARVNMGKVCEVSKVKVNSRDCSSFTIKYRGVRCD